MTHFLTPTPRATLQPLVWYVVIYLSSVSACPLVTDCVELLSKGWWWWWGTVNDKRMTVGGGFIRVEEEPWRHTIMSPKQLIYSFRVTLLLLSTKQSRIYFLKVGVWNRIKMNKKLFWAHFDQFANPPKTFLWNRIWVLFWKILLLLGIEGKK